MTSVVNENTEISMNNDDSDINDEDNEVEIHYIENCWNQDEEIKTGYSYKGKKPYFLKAVDNVKLLLRKGVQKQIASVAFKVLDCRKAKHSAEYDVEITKATDRGVAFLRIYGPNA